VPRWAASSLQIEHFQVMPASGRLPVFHRRITGVCGPNVDPKREAKR
jgi:hypothetical protein